MAAVAWTWCELQRQDIRPAAVGLPPTFSLHRSLQQPLLLTPLLLLHPPWCSDGKWTVIGSRKDLYHAGTGEFAGYLYAEASDIQNSRYVFTDASNTTCESHYTLCNRLHANS